MFYSRKANEEEEEKEEADVPGGMDKHSNDEGSICSLNSVVLLCSLLGVGATVLAWHWNQRGYPQPLLSSTSTTRHGIFSKNRIDKIAFTSELFRGNCQHNKLDGFGRCRETRI